MFVDTKLAVYTAASTRADRLFFSFTMAALIVDKHLSRLQFNWRLCSLFLSRFPFSRFTGRFRATRRYEFDTRARTFIYAIALALPLFTDFTYYALINFERRFSISQTLLFTLASDAARNFTGSSILSMQFFPHSFGEILSE